MSQTRPKRSRPASAASSAVEPPSLIPSDDAPGTSLVSTRVLQLQHQYNTSNGAKQTGLQVNGIGLFDWSAIEPPNYVDLTNLQSQAGVVDLLNANKAPKTRITRSASLAPKPSRSKLTPKSSAATGKTSPERKPSSSSALPTVKPAVAAKPKVLLPRPITRSASTASAKSTELNRRATILSGPKSPGLSLSPLAHDRSANSSVEIVYEKVAIKKSTPILKHPIKIKIQPPHATSTSLASAVQSKILNKNHIPLIAGKISNLERPGPLSAPVVINAAANRANLIYDVNVNKFATVEERQEGNNAVKGSLPVASGNPIEGGGDAVNYQQADGSSFDGSKIKRATKRMSPDTERYEIMLTFEKCVCSWCCEDLDIGDGIVLQECFHPFCRSCLVAFINSSKSTEVRCPYPADCEGRIFDSEIKLLLKPDEYEAHARKSDDLLFAALPNMFYCKTPDCRGFCEFEADSKVFLCPICNKSNCLACKVIHEGVECGEYQRVLQQALNSGKTAEEAQEYAKEHATNGFEQLIGTVSGWMSAASIRDPTVRKSQQYMRVFEKMANQDLWISNKEFDCSICFETVPVGGGVIFDCMHSFCRDCSVGVVQHATEPEIRCPYQDGNHSCLYILKPREIRALVSPELYEIHLSRSLKLAENAMANTFHCKTPDCTGWCEFDPGTEVFHCWICRKRNCLLCGVIHDGLSCADYKNRLVQNVNDVKSNEAVEAMITSGECLRCPNCKVPVQKISGCDWVPCTACKTEICWITKGPRWGPGGKGDISGGCRCRVNGKLCHPRCGNCH